MLYVKKPATINVSKIDDSSYEGLIDGKTIIISEKELNLHYDCLDKNCFIQKPYIVDGELHDDGYYHVTSSFGKTERVKKDIFENNFLELG